MRSYKFRNREGFYSSFLKIENTQRDFIVIFFFFDLQTFLRFALCLHFVAKLFKSLGIIQQWISVRRFSSFVCKLFKYLLFNFNLFNGEYFLNCRNYFSNKHEKHARSFYESLLSILCRRFKSRERRGWNFPQLATSRATKAIKISKHKQGSTIMAIKLCSNNEKFLNMFRSALNTLKWVAWSERTIIIEVCVELCNFDIKFFKNFSGDKLLKETKINWKSAKFMTPTEKLILMHFPHQIIPSFCRKFVSLSDKRMICNFLRNLTATNCRQFFAPFRCFVKNAISLGNNFVMSQESSAISFSSDEESNIIIYISCIIAI